MNKSRLTDAELDEAFDYVHGSLRLTAALSELKERRAGELTELDVVSLQNARVFVEAWSEHTASRIERGRCKLALIALSKLLANGGAK